MVKLTAIDSVENFVDQIKELTTDKPLNVEEFCLMYSFRYGQSVNDTLSALGLPADIDSFVNMRTDIVLDNDMIYSLVFQNEQQNLIKTFSPLIEVEKIMKDIMVDNKNSNSPLIEMKMIFAKFTEKFGCSLSSVIAKRPIDFFQENSDKFIMKEGKVMLAPPGLGMMMSANPDTSCTPNKSLYAPPTPILTSFAKFNKEEENNKKFSPSTQTVNRSNSDWDKITKRRPSNITKCITNDYFITSSGKKEKKHNDIRWDRTDNTCRKSASNLSSSTRSSCDEFSDSDNEKSDQIYYDLHTKISSRSFNSRVAQTSNAVIEAIENCMFLSIEQVAKCGAAGSGTVIDTCASANLVIFVKNLPHENQANYMPNFLRMLKAIVDSELPQHLVQSQAVINPELSAVTFQTKDTLKINIQVAPAFPHYNDAIIALGELAPSARMHFAPVFAKEMTHFVGKQPGSVKVTIRLLKWWRGEQTWSHDLYKPSDDIINLLVIYSAMQGKPKDQKQAVANVLSLFSHFDELRVFWNNYYKKSDIWAPLLLQKPLLMDPVNPFVNIVDPQVFDPSELMEKAASTRFFY